MGAAEQILRAVDKLERLEAALKSTSERRDPHWKQDYVRLRSDFQNHIVALGRLGDELTGPAIIVKEDLKTAYSHMRAAVAIHQGTWPVVRIDRTDPDYLRSLNEMRAIIAQYRGVARRLARDAQPKYESQESIMRVALAGAGAFGEKHLDGLKNIAGVHVTSIIGGTLEATQAVAAKYGIGHATTQLEEALARDDVDAVILCTPTQLHAAQAIACMDAGKHVQVEIPLADSWADSQAVLAKAKQTGLICMVGHTRRFNPSHQYIHNRICAGELNVQQMDVQTYFFRRRNINAKGEPRSWTDHLLWHHAAHTVDLFAYQAGRIVDAHAIQGPIHPELGIAMDMSIQLKSESGAICTLSLSFNNDGPLGTFFRYICDNGTYIARYDDLVNGKEEPVDISQVAVSMNGIELQDREFVAAIREGREPNSSVARVFDCYRVLGELEAQLQG